MANKKFPLFCYMLLLICVNKVCYGNVASRLEIKAVELSASLQQDLAARNEFKLYISKLKNVESGTLMSTVTALIDDVKEQLNASNPNSKCAEDARSNLQALQAHTNEVFRDSNKRISDITTPEDQLYHDLAGNQLSGAINEFVRSCYQPAWFPHIKCDSSNLFNLMVTANTFNASVQPLKEANKYIRPLYKRLSTIQTQYELCQSQS